MKKYLYIFISDSRVRPSLLWNWFSKTAPNFGFEEMKKDSYKRDDISNNLPNYDDNVDTYDSVFVNERPKKKCCTHPLFPGCYPC